MMKYLQQTLTAHSHLIEWIDKIIFYTHAQNYDKALRILTEVYSCLDTGMEQLQAIAGEERISELGDILKDIFQAQNNKDYVLVADLLELRLRRYLIQLQEDIIYSEGFSLGEAMFEDNRAAIREMDAELCELLYGGISPFKLADKGYEIEFSSCGLMTLALTDSMGRYYAHSNSRIRKEAFTLANAWYEEEKTKYIVYGFGLGYHIQELLHLDSSIEIEVYEADLNILKLAAAYTSLGTLMKYAAVRIIYDPKYTKMLLRLKDLTNEEKFVIHYPSLRHVADQTMKEKLENYFIQYSSINNQRKAMNGNFRSNITCYDGFAVDLKVQYAHKDLYIVAAGPSLDKNFLLLKEVDRTKCIIIATGTVYRKLLAAGIEPDYFIVSDANERVYAQIAGLEKERTPMLFLSTAYKGFAQNYQGKKYIILQKDFEKAEDFAKEHNIMLNSSGGSVSTTALDLGISWGCRRIIFLGLDLAYTDNLRHASETSLRQLENNKDYKEIPDVYGNPVRTSSALDMYRIWIEKRIRKERGIEFIDATEGGARIEGMKCVTLKECIKDGS